MESEDKQVGSSKPKEKWIQNNIEKEKEKKKKQQINCGLNLLFPAPCAKKKALCFI